MIEPPLRGSSCTWGVTDERRTSNGRNVGATSCGAVLPGALTATVTSTASQAATVSGACATIASCAKTRRWITSPSRRAAARRESASASSPVRRAPRARRCRGADRPVAGRVLPWVAAVVAAARSWTGRRPRRRRRHHHPLSSYAARARNSISRRDRSGRISNTFLYAARAASSGSFAASFGAARPCLSCARPRLKSAR